MNIFKKIIQKWRNKENDEFDSSLDMDGVKMFKMNDKQKEEYVYDLVRRRNRVHYRDMD